MLQCQIWTVGLFWGLGSRGPNAESAGPQTGAHLAPIIKDMAPAGTFGAVNNNSYVTLSDLDCRQYECPID